MEKQPKEEEFTDEESLGEGSDQGVREEKQNKFNTQELEDIQKEIQEMTKKIEHEKINLRICTERYDKKYATYCELQGKPVPMSKEDKEKERNKNRKKKKNHKVSDPVDKKQTKDAKLKESQAKTLKETHKNQNELGTLTNEINELILSNQALKEEIKDLRKQKNTAIKQRDQVVEDNDTLQTEIDELKEKNKNYEHKIKNKELKSSIKVNRSQKENFAKSRDDLELEYHKLIEESIRREREQKKEQAKKRQLNSLVSDSKASFKGANALELEKQKKLMASEEISDRTPITEEMLAKWKYMNKFKKYMIDKYAKNSNEIREAFNKLLLYLGIDDYDDLPLVFKKGQEQLTNVNAYLANVINDIHDLKTQKELLKHKINYLSEKKIGNVNDKSESIKKREEAIAELNANINRYNQAIENKRNLFKRIQPETDKYLTELNNTYLSEYVHDKCQIDSDLAYNEKTVYKFISNVEEYYKLIQMFEQAMEDKKKGEEVQELEKLRKEMVNKLCLFDKEKLFTESLYTSMKMDSKIGMTFDDIIKQSSEKICKQIDNLNLFEKKTIKKKKKKKLEILAA
jgi:hypothetical protein